MSALWRFRKESASRAAAIRFTAVLLRNHRNHPDRVKRRRRRAREISTRSMRSYTGWCGSPDYLINHVSQSSQSFGWHDNARSYNSAHGWWLLPCHQIADIIPGVSEREYCNRAGNFDVEWAGRKRLWDVVRVNYRRMGLRFRLAWHDRFSFIVRPAPYARLLGVRLGEPYSAQAYVYGAYQRPHTSTSP